MEASATLFFHRCCQDEPVPMQPQLTSLPGPQGSSLPSLVFWISRIGVRHLLSRTPVKLPTWSHQTPSCEARRWYSYPSPKEKKRLCEGLTAALSKKVLPQIFLATHCGRETQIWVFISLWQVFPSGLFYNSLWYLIWLVLEQGCGSQNFQGSSILNAGEGRLFSSLETIRIVRL